MLRDRWTELNVGLGVPEGGSLKWWDIIQTRYSEPQRYYHTLAHLEDMFTKFDTVKEKLNQPAAVALAIFFHDIIYEPTKPDNEEQSADLFQEYTQDCGSTEQVQSLKDTVVDWILATKKHQTPEHVTVGAYGQTDLHYFLDMDMAVLGRLEEDYRAYVDEIEQEYSHMAVEAFNQGRTTVLKKFLEVPNIYATKEFRDLYERQARQNIENEISRRENAMG